MNPVSKTYMIIAGETSGDKHARPIGREHEEKGRCACDRDRRR